MDRWAGCPPEGISLPQEMMHLEVGKIPGEGPSCLLLLLGTLGVPGLVAASFPSLHPSSCGFSSVSVSLLFCLLEGPCHWMYGHPHPGGPHLRPFTASHLQRPCFQIRSLCQVDMNLGLGGRILINQHRLPGPRREGRGWKGKRGAGSSWSHAGVVLADVIHELQGHIGHCPLSLQVQTRLKFSEARRESGEAGNSPCAGDAGEGCPGSPEATSESVNLSLVWDDDMISAQKHNGLSLSPNASAPLNCVSCHPSQQNRTDQRLEDLRAA